MMTVVLQLTDVTDMEQVKGCPSGALSYFMNNEGNQESQKLLNTVVKVLENEPLLSYGNLKVKDEDSSEISKS